MSGAASNDVFLKELFEHILKISKGICDITEEEINCDKSEIHQQLLEGLLYLHQDLELYKVELRAAMENEYKLKMLKEQNEQLEQFNHATSHDLREPIRSISSFSSLLLKSNSDNLTANGKDYLRYIMNASQRMWHLTADLLSYTEVGQKRKISEVAVQPMLETICTDLSALLQHSVCKIEFDGLPTIHAFKYELGQLFQNLISNAIKFSKPDSSQQIEIKYTKLPGFHQFSVSDQGIGIPEDQQEKIFEIFKRLHRKEAYEGTGLGLALCKRAVAMHYGEIWVKSKVNKGSTFFFTISDELNS